MMNRKRSWKRWGSVIVVLTLFVGMFASFGGAAPVQAAADSIKDLIVTPSTVAAGADAEYRIQFTIDQGLLNLDLTENVYIELPSGFTAAGSGTAQFLLGGSLLEETFTFLNQLLTISVPQDLLGDTEVDVRVPITNPLEGGTYSLQVYTSKDTVRVPWTVDIGSAIAGIQSVTFSSGAVATINGQKVLSVSETTSSIDITVNAVDPTVRLSLDGGADSVGTLTRTLSLPPDKTSLTLKSTSENKLNITQLTYLIQRVKLPGSTIDTLPQGSVIRFGGEDWVLINPMERKLLLRKMYNVPQAWENGAVSWSSAEDPSLRYDPARPGSLAEELNSTFLNTLNTGAGEPQWIVPGVQSVPFLKRDASAGTISVDSAVPSYETEAKAGLLTYEEYESLRGSDMLFPDDDVTGWDSGWYLVNPIRNGSDSQTYISFVTPDGAVSLQSAEHEVRPTVQLQSNIVVAGGLGTPSLPYEVKLLEPTDPVLSIDWANSTAGEGTAVMLAFAPNRSLAEGEAVTVAFPSGTDLGGLGAAASAITAGVTGSLEGALPVTEVTVSGTTASLVLPMAVEYGETLELVFPEEASLVNGSLSGSYSVSVSIAGVTTPWRGIVQLAASTNTLLDGVTLSSGSLSPSFSPFTHNYSVSVPDTIGSIAVTAAVPMDLLSTVEVLVDGETISGDIPLPLGGYKDVVVRVTAPSLHVRDYTIRVFRLDSAVSLTNVFVTGGESPFQLEANSYRVMISEAETEPSVAASIPLTADVTVTGATYSVDAGTLMIDVVPGTESFRVDVTAQDLSLQSYFFSVIRLSTLAEFQHFLINDEDMAALVNDTQGTVTIPLPVGTDSVELLPHTIDPEYAELKIGGVIQPSGHAYMIDTLVPGEYPIELQIESADGRNMASYTVIFVRPPEPSEEPDVPTDPIGPVTDPITPSEPPQADPDAPKAIAVTVDRTGGGVRVLFDRELDTSYPLMPVRFELSGTNGTILYVNYDLADVHNRSVRLTLSSSGEVEWEQAAALSVAAGAVRGSNGTLGAEQTAVAIRTPAHAEALRTQLQGSSGLISLRSILIYTSGHGMDVNGDGSQDRYDMAYLLEQLDPMIVQP